MDFIAPELRGEPIDLGAAALVEPQRARPECFSFSIELGEAFALIGNGDGGNALAPDLAEQFAQRRLRRYPPILR